MSPRTAAWSWLGGFALLALVLTLLLTPWGAVTSAPDGLVRRAFGADLVARGNAFAAEIRPATYSSLVLGVLVALWLGMSRRGLRLVRRVCARLRWWWLQALAVVAVVSSAVWLVTVPLAVWREVVLRRWGLSTQDWGSWLLDEVKGVGLTVGLTGVGLVLLVGVARLLPRWWFVPAGLGAAGLVFAMSFVYPVVVEPVFNDFRPMRAGQLRASLVEMAAVDGVPVDEVLVADASRRTTALNAYVSGFGATRRIVVYDNLLREPDPQVRSVVAHELGHADADDVLVASTIGAAGTAAGIGALALILSSGWLRRRGVDGAGDPAVAATVLALATALTVVGSPVESLISRQVEARADQHALDLARDPQGMVEVQQNLAVRNLADLDPPWFSYVMFATHPTAGQRIAMAREWASAHGVEVRP
ncbi:MAG TPA: M48 family metalloprotease [Nocardioidaceae bacterium]|nr:M48 family metalloprotease [Nocardioidaceae bacterium]